MATLETTIDRFGRVVIPKPVRDQLGLSPGTVLEVRETPEGILLRRPPPAAALVVRDGLLVYSGRAQGDLDQAVRVQRQERLRKLRGRRR